MKRVEFWKLHTHFDTARGHPQCPPDFTSETFYRRYVSRFVKEMTAGGVVDSDKCQVIAEWRHERLGRPYCKIHADIAEKLGQTKINIDCADVKVPLQSLEIRLPKYHNPFQETHDSPPLRTIFIARSPGQFPALMTLERGLKMNDDGNRLWFWLDFGEKIGEGINLTEATQFTNVELVPGQTIAERLDRLPPPSKAVGYNPTIEFVHSSIALAISACFFIDGRHELVAPDVSPRLIERFANAKNERDQEKFITRSKELGEGWWDLGREVELPRPIVVSHGHTETGTGLTWVSRYSHIRSGHMRRQPYGPRTEPKHKIIFIEPTVVREDLPARQPTRFVIPGES